MTRLYRSYDIVLADPAWPYYGSKTKDAAAGKHYDLMELEDICSMPVREACNDKAALFMWATGPLLPMALQVMEAWGFHYRGVAWVWVKTRKDGGIISGQGVPPTFTKPTTEFVLAGSLEEPDPTEFVIAGTTMKKGRAFPLLDSAAPQVVLHPRLRHSEKPAIFKELIERISGDRPRLELFARQNTPGWDASGIELDGTNYLEGRIL